MYSNAATILLRNNSQAEVFEEVATMDFPFEGIPTVPPRKDVDHLVSLLCKSKLLCESKSLQGPLQYSYTSTALASTECLCVDKHFRPCSNLACLNLDKHRYTRPACPHADLLLCGLPVPCDSKARLDCREGVSEQNAQG